MSTETYKFSVSAPPRIPGGTMHKLPQTYLKFKTPDKLQPRVRLRVFQKNEPIQVLIADDDGNAREKLRLQLTACKCVVTCVASGSAAISVVEENPEIDLVILNWMMPGLSGLITAQTIKRIAPQVRVLVMVGERFIQSVETAFPALADGYIRKPADVYSLRDILPHLALVRKQRSPGHRPPSGKFAIKYNPKNRGYSYKKLLLGA